MTVFIAVLLTVVSFGVVAYPFFRHKKQPPAPADSAGLQRLRSRKDTAYSMLKELEFDYQSGILTEEDYRELEEKYKQKAISILKDIDSAGAGDNLDEEIERKVQEARQGRRQFCSQCGAKYQEGDRFCSQCGASLERGETVD